MIIKGISRKGKNRIHEGLGTEVIVLMKNHPGFPPGVFIAPISDPTVQSKFSRWIKLQDDPDFEILSK